MKFLAAGLRGLAIAILAGGALAQQTFTPAQYKVTVYDVAMSTDGAGFVTVFESTGGLVVDLVDPSTFANAFGAETAVAAGEYKWVKMTVSRTLVWSHPDPPVSLSDQSVVVNGPPGPSPDKMTVYMATYDQGGKPSGPGGADGTQSKPFLLGLGADIQANVDNTLRMVFAVTDTLIDQGGGSYDLAPPEMFFVTENAIAANLSGSFNTVLYNSVKKFQPDGMGNFTVDDWEFMSGIGTLTFDGIGSWTWTGTINDFDLDGGASGQLRTNETRAGRYGVNADGSFWMIATGEPGTLQGAKSSDGTTIVATMFDSQSSHMMIFGVQRAASASVATMNTGYYFTTYGTRYDSGATRLDYQSSFGMVTGDGSGSVNGSQDTNTLQVVDPTGTPSITPPSTNIGTGLTDTLSVSTNGTMSNTGGELRGGMLDSGDAAAIVFDFDSPYNPSHKFGFLVRQSPAGTFSASSLNGTYFGGHFGDVFAANASRYFSGFFKIVFDGAGSATVVTVENREGTIASQSFAVTYAVDSTTGIVTFSDPGGGEADMKGAIGPNAMSFILATRAEVGGTPNDQRFLGLGLKQ